MDDDSRKDDPRPTAGLGAYAELYPSIGARLRAAEQSVDPAIRRKLEFLKAAFEAREGARQAQLVRVYGLSPTEARIAVHLADGGSVAGYAEMAGVSPATARSQLKSIFAKTGVNRQAALSALVGRR